MKPEKVSKVEPINQSMNIYQRIIEVMKLVKYVQKESKKINGQYTYVSHDAVTSALHLPMAENGIVMIPNILELVQDGNRTIAKMEISFINADNPLDKISINHYGYGIDTQDKGIGKAVSYAVKYALLKTFCLETGDDVEKDSIEYQPKEVKKEEQSDLTDKELENFVSRWGGEEKDNFKLYMEKLMKAYKWNYRECMEKFIDKGKDPAMADFQTWLSKQAK